MSQPDYLLRARRVDGKHMLLQVEALRVAHPEITRVKRDYGVLREVESTGRVRNDTLHIYPRGGDHPIVAASGFRGPDGYGGVVPNTAAGVKSTLRRIRPPEAAELDAIDAEIADAEQVVTRLRRERTEIVQRAWTNGNVVRLQAVRALIKESGGR
jgi:hypothetical protein